MNEFKKNTTGDCNRGFYTHSELSLGLLTLRNK